MKFFGLSFYVVFFALVSSATAQNPAEETIEITAELLFPIHLEAAREYSLFPDAVSDVELKLEEQPVFVWSNPRRAGGQAGHMFLWKNEDRPLAVGTIFSFGWQGVPTNRRLVHEWHSLAESQLLVKRGGQPSQWQPKSGVQFEEIPEVNAASKSPARQRLELRNIAQQFEIHSIDPNGQRWPLRVLSAPLCQYRVAGGLGALVAWAGDAGNDPELLMLMEPREASDELKWHYVPIRMTDHELYLSKDRKPLWQSVRSEQDTSFYDANHLYFRFPDKLFPIDESAAQSRE